MKTLTLLAFLVISSISLFAQNESPIPRIGQQLNDYYNYCQKEKVFITTDKQYYKPGETIWFSAKVIDSQMPAIPSQELMVKLYNKKGESIVGDKFLMNNGSTPGDLQIPDKLPGDQYFLIAYSSMKIDADQVFCTILNIDPAYSNQLIATVIAKDSISIAAQKNELFIHLCDLSGDIRKNFSLRYQLMNGKEVIETGKIKTDETGKAILPFTLPAKSNGEPFICELSDSKLEWKKEFFLPSNLDPIIISFYPEGGTIVADVTTKIGFTAHNKWGIPVNIEGSVINQDGKQVGIVKTITKGLGLFPVKNDENQKLKLVLSGKTGQNQSFDLPTTNASGLAFSVVKTDADFISSNLVFADKQKHIVVMTATNGSSIYWAADLEINAVGRVKIPTENLPQGINLLSVFSNDKKLLASRLVFVDKKLLLKVEVLPEKNNLKQGEIMKLKIRLTDGNSQPVSGNISISIADSYRKTETASPIGEFQLIGAGLKTPFSLIPEAFKDQTINPALIDVFLIANQLKNFDWKKIMQFKAGNASDNYTGANSISGFVTDKNGRKVNKAKVSLVINKNMQLSSITTNEDGLFSFPNLDPENKNDYSVKATDPTGNLELKIELNKNFEDRIVDYIEEISKRSTLLNNELIVKSIYFKNNPDLFSRAPKISKPNTVAIDNQKRLLSTSSNLLDVIKTIKPFNITNNQIVFVGSENSINAQGGALIIWDGQQMGTDVSNIQNISPLDVDHINISTNPIEIQRYTGLNSVGIIEIFSKRAAFSVSSEKENTNQYNGQYRIPNVFPIESTNPKRDFRTTLQWIPELQIDETGQAEISVTAGKVLSDFIIEVNGMAANGRFGSGSAKFSVAK